MVEINPCPFCNTPPRLNHERFHWGTNIECANRFCLMYGYLGNREANFKEWQSMKLSKYEEEVTSKANYIEAWGDDSNLSIEELRARVRLLHSWVKQHQMAINHCNIQKNSLREELDLEKSFRESISELLKNFKDIN